MNSRRVIGGLIRFGLVLLSIALIAVWIKHRVPRHEHVSIETHAPPDSLGPGDLRIYNADSSVDLVLQGDRILAGLSAKTVAKVKGSIAESRAGDTSGLGGMISSIVKTSVAEAIGTHAVFKLSDIKDISADGGRVRVTWTDGADHDLFGGTKMNGHETSTFSPEDARRFVDAVRARKGLPAGGD